MTKRTTPPFRADHVGCLLRPAALKSRARAVRARAKSTPPRSRRSRTARSQRVIGKQEEVGLQSITDGEFRRSWWHLDFLWGLDGVEKHVMDGGVAFAGVTTRNEGVKVTGKLGFSGHPMLEHFKFVAAHTKRTPKITIPSPSAHLRPADATPIDQAIYPKRRRFLRRSRPAPTKKPCAPSPTPAAAICSSTRCSSPCCAIDNYRAQMTARGDDPGTARPALWRSDQHGDRRTFRPT